MLLPVLRHTVCLYVSLVSSSRGAMTQMFRAKVDHVAYTNLNSAWTRGFCCSATFMKPETCSGFTYLETFQPPVPLLASRRRLLRVRWSLELGDIRYDHGFKISTEILVRCNHRTACFSLYSCCLFMYNPFLYWKCPTQLNCYINNPPPLSPSLNLHSLDPYV